jgi:long-subunit acyl-CoA synthetase (AMP-forming)
VAPSPIENKYIVHPRIELACVGGRGQPAAHIIVLLGEDATKAVKEGGEKDAIEKEMEEHLKKVNDGLDEHEKIVSFLEGLFCLNSNEIGTHHCLSTCPISNSLPS